MPASTDHTILAGAAAVEVTPPVGCHLAGFGHNRRAETVHDPLWARALTLQAGRQTVVLVSVDCLGLLAVDAEAIASRAGLRVGQLVVCATHTHSGPDTLGLWGPDDQTSGCEPAVVADLLDGAATAVAQALGALRPALLTFTRATAPPRCAVNLRDPDSVDPEIAVLHCGDAGTGRAIGTLVNWACHPEVLQHRSQAISSDFVDPLRRRLEETLGGVTVFANGALGAMVSPAAAGDGFDEATRIGQAVADEVVIALRAAEEVVEETTLAVATREVAIPLDNDTFREASRHGVLRRPVGDLDYLTTTVTAWSLGPATLLMVPGEAQPVLGRRWKRMMSRRHRFVIGLANDELGYILRPDDARNERYAYEAAVSCGVETGYLLHEAVQRVLAAVDG